MSRSPAIFRQIVDATGQPISGGLLYTYTSGTTDLLTTYSDAAKTTPNANPLVANAAGVVGPVYMTDNTAYTFVEKTAAGVTLRSEDGIYSVELTNNSTATRVKQIAANPLDYGAVGDGVADEEDDVNAAIAAVSGVGTVDLLGLTYRCDDQLTIDAGLTLKNGVLNFASATGISELIRVHGSISPGTFATLTAAASKGDMALTVDSTANLSVGDLLALTSDEDFSDSASIDRGEIVEIESIGGATTINLMAPLKDAYNSANNAFAYPITLVENVRFEDLTIIGSEALSGAVDTFSLQGCRRVTFKNVRIESVDAGGAGILINGCYDIAVLNSSIQDGTTGIEITGCSQAIRVEQCNFSGVATALYVYGSKAGTAPPGIPSDILFKNNVVNMGGEVAADAINVTGDAQLVTIDNNIINCELGTTKAAIALACVDATISNNIIFTPLGGSNTGLDLNIDVPARTRSGSYVKVVGNTMSVGGAAIDIDCGLTGTLSDLEIAGNAINANGGSSNAININQVTAGITHCKIHDNYLLGTIAVANTASTGSISVLDIYGNYLYGSMTIDGNNTTDNIVRVHVHDMYLTGALTINEGSTNVVVENVISSSTLTVTEGTKVNISACDFTVINVTNASSTFSNCTVDGCLITTAEDSSGIVIAASAATSADLVISNNTIKSSTADAGALDISGRIGRFLISNNIITRGDDDYAAILLTGAAAGSLSSGLITGNVLTNGTYGIEASNISNVYASGNLFFSMATGSTTGLTSITKDFYIDTAQGWGTGPVATLGRSDSHASGIHYISTASTTPRVLGNSPNSSTQTDSSYYLFSVPPNYKAGGTATLVINAQATENGDTQTVDASVKEVASNGTLGAELYEGAALTVTTSAADKSLSLVATNISPGDLLVIQLITVFADLDGAVGELQVNTMRFTLEVTPDFVSAV